MYSRHISKYVLLIPPPYACTDRVIDLTNEDSSDDDEEL